MSSPADPHFRRRQPADMPGAFLVFRRSLSDYLLRTGQITEAATRNSPEGIEQAWGWHGSWMEHLGATAAEDWVAEDADGRIVGWAQSIERDGMLELTFFFVDPEVRTQGIGRGLLDRAFPLGRGQSRVISATLDTAAVSLYLRYGVSFAATTIDFLGKPTVSVITTDLAIERVEPGTEEAAQAAIVAVEHELLGHGRPEDTRFLLGDRPAWLARRGGRVVGMAFGTSAADMSGPIGALDPADLPALMATVESDAATRGVEELGFTIPMNNRTALDFVLSRRFQVDTFYTFVLSSDDRMRLDRWVQTQPTFII